jgi:hypothetical protein
VVVNKGGLRFLVGHICGAHIYGVDFAVLKKDYDTAVIRQDTLRRVREIRAVVDPFLEWVKQFSTSPVFHLRDELLLQIKKRVPWLWEQLQWHTNRGGGRLNGIDLPATLFDGFTDPERGFRASAAEISRVALLVVGKIEIEKDLGGTIGRLQVLLSQIETAVKQLEEVERFFQLSVLGPVCDWATRNDRKRRYEAGLMTITCFRDQGPITVRVPNTYKVPNMTPIMAFRAAVSNLK